MSEKNDVMTVSLKGPKPTLTQAQVLAEAVLRAYRSGWNGDLGHPQRPKLDRGGAFKVGVAEPTRRALIAKDLVRALPTGPGTRQTYFLTRTGVEAGVKAFADKRGVSPMALAAQERQEEKKRAKEREKRIKDVKYLFRGLKVAARIDGVGVKLNLDDLEVLGKGIERLRTKGKKSA